MEQELRIDGLTVAGRLTDLSAVLAPGAVTAICGPNGAGKSTALAAMAGLLTPDAGQVSLNGEMLAALHPRGRACQIGYLPQNGVVAWDLSVGYLVALGRLPHGDRGEAQVQAAMEALHIAQLAERPVSSLSGGERARALLARVLAGEPEWILADEPLAALDLKHQLDLLGHLRCEADAGRGVVLVLHDLAQVMNHADRVIVLDQGKVVADGVPSHALSSEVVARVWGISARWIGEPAARALQTDIQTLA